MTCVPCPSVSTYAAMRARAEQADQLAEAYRDLLAAVHASIALPVAATDEGDVIRGRILGARVIDVQVTLGLLGDRDAAAVRSDVAYLRARLASFPVTYRTWDEETAAQAGEDES